MKIISTKKTENAYHILPYFSAIFIELYSDGIPSTACALNKVIVLLTLRVLMLWHLCAYVCSWTTFTVPSLQFSWQTMQLRHYWVRLHSRDWVRLHSRDLSKILIISQYQHFPQICCFLRFLWSKPIPGRAPHISVTAPFVDKHGESTCD